MYDFFDHVYYVMDAFAKYAKATDLKVFLSK